jgi:ribonucleotide reductase alpha subunit
MIDTCVNDNASTAHQKFAGRLFIGNLYHELYGNEWSIPTVREQHEKLLAKGMVEDLHFTDEEWEEINSFVDHKRDLDMKYSQVVQIVKKYVLTDVKTGKPVESPQFTFMRQACWYTSKDNKGDTLTTIKDIYELLSKDVLCAPTPDHLYINTPKGVAPSCVVIRGGDSLQAISAALTATMECSASGSGIGMSLELRSPTDPVGTSTTHAGKHAYYNAVDAMARANKQAGRAGAVTTYYTCLDPELLNIARWKNPTTPPDVRLGDLDYAFGANDAFADAVREDKLWMLVSCYYAPKLWELLYQPDKELFNAEYERVKADDTIPKKFVSARKILFCVLRESVETRQYEYFTDELNRHTPFKETIYSSNLCVSSDTLILTDKGNVVISDVVDQTVNVWNGEEWSETVVRKTGENQSLVRVMLKSGKFLDCTPYHKFYVLANWLVFEVRAGDLNEGDTLIGWRYPNEDGLFGWCAPETVVSVSPVGGLHDTYCFNEPKRHMGVFNGILTGQCTEIALPTKSFDKGTIELHDPNSDGEIATCNLMGINVATINGDLDLYYKAAYYALLMCRIKIIHGNYPFASMKRTAIARLSAGVSMISVAHLMAKNGMKYSSLWGKKFFHRLAETHSYMLHKAALEIGKKYGLPEWIDRTKYPDGWLPIDTRNKYAMEIAHQPLKHDWETLRKEIVEAGGIGFSVLETAVPSESEGQAQDATNG